MDLVECEAPLDSSFQKDRLELVNKGSLGRRRKPSRSNLRLILSPANDQQDIDVFHNHQQFESEGSFIQENGTSSNPFTENVLDNQQESVIGVCDHRKNSSDYQKKDNCPKNSRENGIVNNYRDVVESINQIYKAKCIDFNGNSHQRVVTSRYHQNYTSGDSVHVVQQNGDQKVKSENNNVSSKHNLQTSVIRNQQNSDANSYQVFTKLNNSNHVTKSSTYHSTFATKNQNASESKSCQQTSNIRNQQNKERKASSNNHQNIITFSNHRQIVTSTPVQTRSIVPNGKHQERTPNKDCSSKLYIDVRPDETMLYRVSDSRNRALEVAKTANGRVEVNGKLSENEPEWISLSRKLCAKFVEGHIESHSPDSYPHEEPEGVGEEPIPSLQSIKTHSSTNTTVQAEVQKKKVIPSTPSDETPTSDEPPWIHLSRKLCTKFIEEHIEYPPITNGHFIEVPELIEPNGDVRIIEKIGKPKGRKSKQKKECEPEWISLSKKLRAKFIESHIDDPDTIALDNQLNVSDHEETGSESLSDVSQETAVPKRISPPPNKAAECKNFTIKNKASEAEKDNWAFCEKENEQNRNGPAVFPEKECCWEYQEMEFDQESNSGNFQEFEFFDQPPQEEDPKIKKSPSQDPSGKLEERRTFENSFSQQNPECYNNDVKFAPRMNADESDFDCPQKNKLITVQFIAHVGNDPKYKHEDVNDASHNTKDTKGDSFFNLSTWEEAHFEQKVEEGHQISDKETIPHIISHQHRNSSSKSLSNLCDSAEARILNQNEDFHENEIQNSSVSSDVFFPEENNFTESEKISNRNGNEIYLHEFKVDPVCSSNISSVGESPNSVNENIGSEPDGKALSWCNFYQEKKQNIYDAINAESSSEDEVFEYESKNNKTYLNSSNAAYCDKVSIRNCPSLENEKYVDPKPNREEKVKSDSSNKKNKNIKCNGMIPNSIYSGLPDNKQQSVNKNNHNEISGQKSPKEPTKMGMSKWITISKSEQNISKPEYSNIQSSIHKEQRNGAISVEMETESNNKSKKNNKEKKNVVEKKAVCNPSGKNTRPKYENEYPPHSKKIDENSYKFSGSFEESDLKTKCKSLVDISYKNSLEDEGSFHQHKSIADLCSATQTSNHPKVEFQHFEFNSEIPLCAKLVSNHNKRSVSKSIPELSTRRTESPCPSESSHVYEDMFKETPSGPSDSEASSWTAVRNNTYYINGRSCSMNDLDFSDSCSMSVKCDYASSSENSTLQSRHSSYASSSFYVNLRDYDSHMLEPSLSKGKRSNGKLTNHGSASKSNPPTPESLRHLFTSPLNSVHSAPDRTPRMLSRMPSDPQSHYYSTAAATSSAFKHGFALAPPKPKKTERSSSIKIKDIAHGIILTFKKFQNHSKNSNLSSTQQVDVSHLAEMKSNSELGKTKKEQKESKKQNRDRNYWTENGKTDTDSGFLSDVQRAKARRSSSDLTGMKSNSDLFPSDKKKAKSSKKNSNRDKGKKSKTKVSEPRVVPTVSRKVQQMADGTLYLVTTVSGDTTLPGVYSDSPDTSSELSSHRPVKLPEESNC